MPYTITMEPTFLRIILHGALTRQELNRLADALAAIDMQRAVALHRLIDMRRVIAPYLTYPDVQAYTARRQARPVANAVRLAIVASRPIHLGFARMYQNLNEHPQMAIEIFATVEAAETWLLASPAL
jgi:hypothetical protein